VKKHKKYIPHEVHFFFAMFALGTSILVILNQYFHEDESLWDVIDPLVIIVLLLVTVFHIFEGIEEKSNNKKKK